jgi:arginase
MMGEFGLLGVPSSAAAHGPGQEKAPAALRQAGLSEQLAAAGVHLVDYGDLPGGVRWRPDPHQRRPQDLLDRHPRDLGDRPGGQPLGQAQLHPGKVGGDLSLAQQRHRRQQRGRGLAEQLGQAVDQPDAVSRSR